MATQIAQVSNPLIDLNFDSIKAHCEELHDFMLSAGFLQTGDTGQLENFDGFTAMPAYGTMMGYRVYKVNDPIALGGSNIFIRMEFWIRNEGMSSGMSYGRSTALRINCEVGPSTDGAGSITSDDGLTPISPPISWGNPQSLSNSASSQAVTYGNFNKYSCTNPERGFFAVVFYCNGRGYVGQYGYNGSSLTLIIQRSLDPVLGTPTNEGFTVYTPLHNSNQGNVWNRFGAWSNAPQTNSQSKTRTYSFAYGETSSRMSLDVNPRPGGLDADPESGRVQVGPCYTYVKRRLQYNPNLVTHRSIDLGEGTQFQLETQHGVLTNYIALGPGAGIFPDGYGQNNGYAMLFE